jgi:aspartate 1-decarboxylase
VLNINNGERFTTYAIAAPAGSGTIGINGAAARLAQKGDLVIIVAYARMEEAEAKSYTPRVVLVDANNRPQAPALRVSGNLKTV